MKIILAPAKQMISDPDSLDTRGLPVFLNSAEELLRYLRSLSYAEAKKLWGCGDAIAEENYERLTKMDLRRSLTPAIIAYDGIAYKYMCPSVFEEGQFDYVQQHLRILSGFYGVLKPMDGVTPYRLEMQARVRTDGAKNLYEFWGDRLYREVRDDSGVIVNLASVEYSRCITAYLQPQDTLITCIFGEYVGQKLVQKGVYAKMARGEMVRWMAEHGTEDPRQLQGFDRLHFCFHPELSTETEYVFVRSAEKRPEPEF